MSKLKLSKPKVDLSKAFQGYSPFFYNSGTSALAIALCMAKARSGEKTEVLVPAYGCPDIISAIVFAELTPVLVDFEKERPYLSVSSLQDKLTDQTLAIVAINFFGIQERLGDICTIAHKKNVAVIEDSAQRAPWKGNAELKGDYVVLSFGRGKPESVLHGGAVLVKRTVLVEQLTRFEQPLESPSFLSYVKYGAKIAAYNILLSPYVFWVLYALPFISIGGTRYKKLTTISPMRADAHQLLHYKIQQHKVNTEICEYINQKAKKITHTAFINLPCVCDVEGDWEQLLRYPILLPSKKEKEQFLLRCAYLGASEMYPSVLPQIDGLNWLNDGSDIEDADDFAQRLVTLPCHSGVKEEFVDQMFRELELLNIK